MLIYRRIVEGPGHPALGLFFGLIYVIKVGDKPHMLQLFKKESARTRRSRRRELASCQEARFPTMSVDFLTKYLYRLGRGKPADGILCYTVCINDSAPAKGFVRKLPPSIYLGDAPHGLVPIKYGRPPPHRES